MKTKVKMVKDEQGNPVTNYQCLKNKNAKIRGQKQTCEFTFPRMGYTGTCKWCGKRVLS